MDKIKIELCRISRRNDQLLLDVIIDIDTNTLTSFEVTNLQTPETIWEFAKALGTPSGRIAFSIPLSDLGDAGSAIYKVVFKASSQYEDYVETMYVSDVEFMYECMLSDLNLLDLDSCTPVSDDLIVKYLLLYGHTLAMAYKDIDRAEYFFKKMKHCLNKCMTPITCNCHGTHR